MRHIILRIHVAVLWMLVFIGTPSLLGQSFRGVLTWHNDKARTGQNNSETTLTPLTVNSLQFGKLFSYPVDGQVYAQPLYVPNVNIVGKGTHNVVYVATEHDSVYAFDADGIVSTPLWHVSFINPTHGIRTISTVNSKCTSMKPEVGISGTPVIDVMAGVLYVVAETQNKTTVVQRLHALNLSSGTEALGGPVVLNTVVSGVAFDPTLLQRPGLLLLNGVVYLSHASLCDPHPYHGWVLGYNAQNLQLESAFVTTPTGEKGGIWQAGAGLASDGGNDIFFMDGDGTFDASTGGSDYAMSMVRLSTSGGLAVADYFTPVNEAKLSQVDKDLGSGGVLVLPPQSGLHPNEIIGGDKEGKIFVVDRDNMGKFNSEKNQIVQTLKTTAGSYYSSPAYWQQNVYYSGSYDYLSMYSLTNGKLSAVPVSQSPTKFSYPGSTPSISADGSANGIVWAIETAGEKNTQGGPPATLHAYDATDVSTELYNSNQAGKRDLPGPGVKFSVPTIANGKVYVGTQGEIDVYGLLNP
ncbi:MAG: PQQ-binding-like beta-propeller repeat protein [Candidatus Sulfotelmatobacter sp.]